MGEKKKVRLEGLEQGRQGVEAVGEIRKRIGVVHVYDDESIKVVEGVIPASMSRSPMKVEMDERVLKLVAFMQSNYPADELRGVTKALAGIADSLWSRHPFKEVHPISVCGVPISARSCR